ncbi:MAG: TPM domain-containing protein [Sphingobacteriales bacterium]|nr:MAG: TPM domain-containing protein [Sphingobacteriales bacterium]
MKHIYLIAFLLAITLSTAEAQPIFTSFSNNSETTIPTATLQEYRQSMWDMPPAAEGWVNDYAGLFNAVEEEQIESLLAHLKKRTGVEIAVISLDSLMVEKDKMEDFSTHVLNAWGIGKIAKNNGILISICRDYRIVKIVSGAGAQQYLVGEGRSGLTGLMVPFFKRHQYYAGTLRALKAIMRNVENNLYGFVAG